MDIKDKLEKQIKEQGTISSDDVASIAAGIDEKRPEDKLKETDTVTLSDAVKNNGVLTTASKGDIQGVIDEAIVESITPLDKYTKLALGDGVVEQVTITPENKLLFLDCIITNKRFILPFSLFNGKLEGEIRTRTQNESFAIFEQLNRELITELPSQLAYSIRLRNILLCTQIVRLNGDHFPELKTPLFKIIDGKTVIQPAWLDQVTYWEMQGDGVVTILFKELRKFEYTYLTMLENASNQNFWKTAPST